MVPHGSDERLQASKSRFVREVYHPDAVQWALSDDGRFPVLSPSKIQPEYQPISTLRARLQKDYYLASHRSHLVRPKTDSVRQYRAVYLDHDAPKVGPTVRRTVTREALALAQSRERFFKIAVPSAVPPSTGLNNFRALVDAQPLMMLQVNAPLGRGSERSRDAIYGPLRHLSDPGQYNVATSLELRERPPGSSGFTFGDYGVGTARLFAEIPERAPPPGAYELPRLFDERSHKGATTAAQRRSHHHRDQGGQKAQEGGQQGGGAGGSLPPDSQTHKRKDEDEEEAAAEEEGAVPVRGEHVIDAHSGQSLSRAPRQPKAHSVPSSPRAAALARRRGSRRGRTRAVTTADTTTTNATTTTVTVTVTVTVNKMSGTHNGPERGNSEKANNGGSGSGGERSGGPDSESAEEVARRVFQRTNVPKPPTPPHILPPLLSRVLQT